ncbi:MAG: PQQ-binding-like beta-propeller repeat protein [bacterium]
MFGYDTSHTGRSPYEGPDTPALEWTYTTNDTGFFYTDSNPVIGADGTIYVGSSDSYFYAINPDGKLKWRYKTGGGSYGGGIFGGIFSSPAIASDGTIYFGSGDNTLYAINANGTLKWTLADVRAHHGHPVIDSAGTIYIGSCAINPDGSLKWRYDYRGGFSSGISSNGTLYINVCTATPGYIAAITSSTEDSDTDTRNSTDDPGDDGSGGGGGGVFGAINIYDVIGYHLDGITKNGTRVYMPVTNGYKALKSAQTYIVGCAPFWAKMIRNSLDSLEVMAETNKDGLLYRIGTYAYPVLGKIAELYLEAVGSEELMTNAYSSTIISVAEFDKQNKEGTAISFHIVRELN